MLESYNIFKIERVIMARETQSTFYETPYSGSELLSPAPEANAVGYVVSAAEAPQAAATQTQKREINLGLAASPIGFARELFRPLRRRDPIPELSEYPRNPNHTATRELLIKGIGLEGIKTEAVEFVDNGSYGAGDEVVRYLSQKGVKTIIASNYSFPNVSQWALRHGVQYETVQSANLNPADATASILRMSPDQIQDKIVYIDYPNNPFGQADPKLIRNIIDHVTAAGGVPLIDLAFGEVLGNEFRSVMQYTIDRGGICLGSLSKTQGLPGLRSGYAIFGESRFTRDYIQDKGEDRLVFGLNREAEFVYQRLFSRDGSGKTLAQKQAERAAKYNTKANEVLYRELEKLGLRIGATDLRTPIQVIKSNIPDLASRLKAQGLIVESLVDYSTTLRRGTNGYNDAAIRMLTPKPGQVKEVVERFKAALAA